MPRLSEIQAINLGSRNDLAPPEESECAKRAKELEAGEVEEIGEIDVSKIAKAVMSGSISQLRFRERRHLSHYILHKEFSEYNPKFARAVIESESGKKTFCRALFNAWLVSFPKDRSLRDKPLSKLIRATLRSNIEKLRDRQKRAHDIFKVLEKNPPFKELSKSILTNKIDLESLELVKFSNGRSAGDFAWVLIVELAAHMKRGRFNEQEYEKYIELVAPSEVIDETSKASALIGIVYPVREHPPEHDLIKKARSVIEKNFVDPRAEVGEWPFIPEILGGEKARNECIEQVKKWEIFQSITLFFHIMEKAIGGDSKHQWPERRKLWLQYFTKNTVSDAWVVLGSKAAGVAARLKLKGDEEVKQLKWGELSGGGDQSVLLLKIGRLTIAEWSHSGACRFWKDSDRQGPQLHRSYYSPQGIRTENENNIEKVIHDDRVDWQGKIKQNIKTHTGIGLSYWR